MSWLLKGAVVSAVALVAAACGSGGNSPSGAGAASPRPSVTASPAPTLSFCQDVAQLRATLESLSPVKGALPTSTQLKAAAADIQSSLSGLGNRTEWQTQIDNLKAAVANMQSAADSLAASPGARGVASNVRVAVAGVNDSIRRLPTAVGSRCPSPSPSAVPSS
jgi:ABC-type Zn uptake system ZnuABC Zn-binding protein ZnuA